MDCRKSAARINNRGGRGSPCLTPLLQLKVFPGIPLSKIAEVAEEKIFSIHEIHFCPKPLALKIVSIAWCLILSNAFSKSILMTTISFLE
jgi:hypothetical protein